MNGDKILLTCFLVFAAYLGLPYILEINWWYVGSAVIAAYAFYALWAIPRDLRQHKLEKRREGNALLRKYVAEADELLETLKGEHESDPQSELVKVDQEALDEQRAELERTIEAQQRARQQVQDDPATLAEIEEKLAGNRNTLDALLASEPDKSALSERALLDEAIARSPHNPVLYVKRSLHFLGNSNGTDLALTDAETALQIMPNYPYALNARGVVRTASDCFIE